MSEPRICIACGHPERLREDMRTCMAVHVFTDATGREHQHDSNARNKRYGCPCGRLDSESTEWPKCWCGWSAPTEAAYNALMSLIPSERAAVIARCGVHPRCMTPGGCSNNMPEDPSVVETAGRGEAP